MFQLKFDTLLGKKNTLYLPPLLKMVAHKQEVVPLFANKKSHYYSFKNEHQSSEYVPDTSISN